MKFQKCFKGCLEQIGHMVSFAIEDEKQKLTVKWTTWLYMDCCCDTCSTCQLPLIPMVPGTDLVYEDSLPKFFYESNDFLRILCLIKEPSNLSLF